MDTAVQDSSFFNSSAYASGSSSSGNFVTSSSSQAEQLYAGTDFNSLSWAERKWVQYYMWFGDPVIATGVMSFLLHEFFYFGRCIPWMIVDRIPYFRRWKIQDSKVPTAAEQWKATKYVLFTHFTVELPQIWGFHPICEYFGLSTHEVPFPNWQTMAIQIIVFFFFEDFYHYVMHRVMHHRKIYKHIHKVHHEYSAPFGLAAEYAHPVEILVLGVGTIGGPFLWCTLNSSFSKIFAPLHIITVYLWVTLRLFQAVDSHAGYDFPWSLQYWFPLWGGADHHDYHHQASTGCFASSFRLWDHVFGTDKGYKALRAKQKAEKLAAAQKAAELKSR